MSGANAVLTTHQRLRLAQQVVDVGWPVASVATYFLMLYPTAAR